MLPLYLVIVLALGDIALAQISVGCFSDADCSFNEQCEFGRCSTRQQPSQPVQTPSTSYCNSWSQDCLPGYRCKNGRCVLEQPSDSQPLPTPSTSYCNSWPDDCLPGYRCKNGRCVSDHIYCTSHRDCPYGRCIRGRCEDHIYCTSHRDCPYGRCIRGRCEDHIYCTSHRDCPYGRCIRGRCEDHIYCTSHRDCPYGRCIRGRCEDHIYCTSHRDCPYGRCIRGRCEDHIYCTSHRDCPYGRCIRGRCEVDTACRFPCALDERCENGICVPRRKRCRFDHECLPYERCRNRRCEEKPINSYGCLTNEDCSYGQQCVWEQCIDTESPTQTPTYPTWCTPYTPRSCPPGYRCNRGVCEKDVLTQPGTCGSDRPCTYPDQCIAGSCVRVIID